jgi:hypothetical protein
MQALTSPSSFNVLPGILDKSNPLHLSIFQEPRRTGMEPVDNPEVLGVVLDSLEAVAGDQLQNREEVASRVVGWNSC